MDIVAVKSTSNNMVEVIGKPKGKTWFSEGWLNENNISYSKTDVAVAVLTSRAINKETEEEKTKALKSILDNPDFATSIFLERVNNEINVVISCDLSEIPPETLGLALRLFP